jgi:hypothetical protein
LWYGTTVCIKYILFTDEKQDHVKFYTSLPSKLPHLPLGVAVGKLIHHYEIEIGEEQQHVKQLSIIHNSEKR